MPWLGPFTFRCSSKWKVKNCRKNRRRLAEESVKESVFIMHTQRTLARGHHAHFAGAISSVLHHLYPFRRHLQRSTEGRFSSDLSSSPVKLNTSPSCWTAAEDPAVACSFLPDTMIGKEFAQRPNGHIRSLYFPRMHSFFVLIWYRSEWTELAEDGKKQQEEKLFFFFKEPMSSMTK